MEEMLTSTQRGCRCGGVCAHAYKGCKRTSSMQTFCESHQGFMSLAATTHAGLSVSDCKYPSDLSAPAPLKEHNQPTKPAPQQPLLPPGCCLFCRQYMAPSFGTNEPMAYAHEEEEEEAQPKEEEDQPSEQQQQQPQPPACKPPTPKPPKKNNRNNNTSSGGSKADTVSAPTNTYDELEDRPVGHDHQAEIPAWRPRPAQPTTNEAKFLPAGQLFKSEDVLAAGTGSTPQHQAADAAAAGTAAAGSAAAESPVAPAGAIGSSFKAIYQAAPDGAARRQVLAAAIQAADNLLGPQLVKVRGAGSTAA